MTKTQAGTILHRDTLVDFLEHSGSIVRRLDSINSKFSNLKNGAGGLAIWLGSVSKQQLAEPFLDRTNLLR